jgi:hypothetical protein
VGFIIIIIIMLMKNDSGCWLLLQRSLSQSWSAAPTLLPLYLLYFSLVSSCSGDMILVVVVVNVVTFSSFSVNKSKEKL